jgi:hypothetical protein
MKPKHFVGLLAAAAVSFVIAFAAYVTTRPWTNLAAEGSQPMLPALKAAGDKVAAVEIIQGTRSIKLANDNGKWVLASHENYPANTEAVRKLVVDAMEASLVERKTAKKENLKLLGLADPKEAGAASRLIRFLDKDGALVAEIIAGNKKSDAFGNNKGGTYVRGAGGDQAWLADRALDGSVNLNDWVTTRVVDVSPDKVKTAEVSVAGQPAYKIVLDADGKTHRLEQMPAGKKLKYVNSIDEIIESASYVDFKSLRKAGKADSLPNAGSVTFETDNGLKVTLDVRSDGKEAWLKITPAGTGAAKTQRDAMAALVTGWEFEVPVAKVSGLLKKQPDLLEDAAS